MLKTLQYFGFGPSIIKWIKCFNSNVESYVLNDGWASNFFQIKRGVRGGCPLSLYLFVFSVEILAKAIRKNKNTKGIHVINNINPIFKVDIPKKSLTTVA